MEQVKEPQESYEVAEDGTTLHIIEYGPEDQFLLADGWEEPNYTQVPNQLLGHWIDGTYVVGQMTDMGEAELKVALVLCRITFGFHKESAAASLSWLEKATGLSRQGVLNGIAALVKRGLFIKDTHKDGRNLWKKVHGSQRGRPEVVNEVDQTSQRGRPNKEILKKEKKDPPPKKRADQEPHPPVKETEYVDLDEDGYPTKTKPPLIKYIQSAGRRLTPKQQEKLMAGVPFHNPKYPSPCTLFETDPLFEEYIRGKIAWASGGVDGQRRQTGSLITAIRNYEHEHHGWLIFKQKDMEAAAPSGIERFKPCEQPPDEPAPEGGTIDMAALKREVEEEIWQKREAERGE